MMIAVRKMIKRNKREHRNVIGWRGPVDIFSENE
jgi:hypothetical protein